MRKRITVGDSVYELRPWSYQEGRRWVYRFAALGTATESAGTDAALVSALLDRLGEAHFEELCATVERYTDVVAMSDEGRETVQPLAQIAAKHMQRRYLDLAMLMRHHLVEEFGDFFARLPEVLQQGGGTTS